MTDTEVTAPTFDAIPIDDLPTTVKGTDPASIALGVAVIGAIDPKTAAGDAERFGERKGAVNRAAVIKRGIRAAIASGTALPDGYTFGTRILAGADGYRVAVLLVKPSKAKAK